MPPGLGDARTGQPDATFCRAGCWRSASGITKKSNGIAIGFGLLEVAPDLRVMELEHGLQLIHIPDQRD